MPYEIKEMTVLSTDNVHKLIGKIYIPEGEIKGLVHVVHGMTEHILRYDPFMSYLCENGYIAFGYDHLGHGKTANNDSELGFIAHNDGWKYLVNDVDAFENAVRKSYPDLPLYLFGHSMGSFVVRLAAVNFSENYEKLIVCGTGGKNPAAFLGLGITSLLKKIKGDKYISDTVLNLAFGSFNKKFDGDSPYEWLTKDRNIIEKYAADKFCTFKFTVSGMHDLIKLNSVCNKPDWFSDIKNKLPIFLISGADDPVGNYGKGVKEVYDKLKNLNKNVKMKLYENCRHEILNDTCKAEVMNDILEFIEE